MRTFIFLLGLLALPVNAQVTFFNDAMGLPMGTANQVGGTTFYNDAKGLPLGTAQNMGNVTLYNDAKGLPLDTANTPQPILPFGGSQPISPPEPFFQISPRGM